MKVEPKQAEAISAWIADAVEGGATLTADDIANLEPITWDAYQGVDVGAELTGCGKVVVPVGGDGGGGHGGDGADAGGSLDASAADAAGNAWGTPVILVDPDGSQGGGGGSGGTSDDGGGGSAPSKGGGGCSAARSGQPPAPLGLVLLIGLLGGLWLRRRRAACSRPRQT